MTTFPASVSRQQKFTSDHPCPVCGGHERMAQGQGIRCWGFLSSDQSYAHCTREEYGGALPQGNDGTYAHRLHGSCKCGAQHGPAIEYEPVAIYHYLDVDGHRWEKGRFQKPDGGKTFSWRRAGVTDWPRGSSGMKLNRLMLLGWESAEHAGDTPVIFTEGEKARQALEDRGYIAVCAGGGAAQRDFGQALDVLRGRNVRLWPDNDTEGEKYAARLAYLLKPIAASVQLIRWREAPPKGDAWDFFAAGNTDDDLANLIEGVTADLEAEEVQPIPEPEPYSFTSVTQSTFVQQFIEYRDLTSDAPLEYAEVLAVGLLSAVAGSRLRISLQYTARTLKPSLYILLLGPSSVYRKSNSLEHAEAMVEIGWTDRIITTPGSPESLVQQLSTHEQGACWFHDELAPWFKSLKAKPYLADMRGYLLRAYDGSQVSRQLRTKKTKNGEVDDVDVAREPALTIMAASVPDRLMEASSQGDIDDGWWPRWIICWPQSRPPLRAPGPLDPRAVNLKNTIGKVLHQLDMRLGAGAMAELSAAAWEESQRLSLEMQDLILKDENNGAFYSRADTRIFKIAALLATTDDLEGSGRITVEAHHIADAAALVHRWLKDAIRFGESVGMNDFENQCSRALACVQREEAAGRQCERRIVHQRIKGRSRDIEEIGHALEDRGYIEIIPGITPNNPVWKSVRRKE